MFFNKENILIPKEPAILCNDIIACLNVPLNWYNDEYFLNGMLRHSLGGEVFLKWQPCHFPVMV